MVIKQSYFDKKSRSNESENDKTETNLYVKSDFYFLNCVWPTRVKGVRMKKMKLGPVIKKHMTSHFFNSSILYPVSDYLNKYRRHAFEVSSTTFDGKYYLAQIFNL